MSRGSISFADRTGADIFGEAAGEGEEMGGCRGEGDRNAGRGNQHGADVRAARAANGRKKRNAVAREKEL